MKALILGVGAVGSVMAIELARDPEVEEVRIADIDLGRAKRFAEKYLEFVRDRVSVRHIDASKPDEVVEAAGGMDVVVNATAPKYNLTVMDAVLKSGVHYQDLASGPVPGLLDTFEEAVFRQLRLTDKWEDAGLAALIDTGCDPGITNVIAREAADKLDRVDEIRIRHFASIESKEPISTWSPETSWIEAGMKPIVYEEGKYKKYPPFSGEEVYRFPEPSGPQTVVLHEHEEPVTLPRFIGKGIKYADYKSGGPWLSPEKEVYSLGLLSTKPINIRGVEMPPINVILALSPHTPSMEEMEEKIKAGIVIDAHACTVVEVDGEKAGKDMLFTLYTPYLSLKEMNKRIPGTTGASYRTGVPAAILTRLLGKGRIKTKGVIAPECLDENVRRLFLTELAEKGIVIYERVERILP